MEQVQQQQAVHTEAHQAQALETLLTGETDIFPVEKVAPTVASPLTIADSNSQHGSATLSPNTSHHNLAAESSSSPSKQEVSSSSDTTIPTSSESAKGSGQYMLVNEVRIYLFCFYMLHY